MCHVVIYSYIKGTLYVFMGVTFILGNCTLLIILFLQSVSVVWVLLTMIVNQTASVFVE